MLAPALPLVDEVPSAPKRAKVIDGRVELASTPDIEPEIEETPLNVAQFGLEVALSPKVSKTGVSERFEGYSESLYTKAFDTALHTVLANEAYLFASNELEIFDRYKRLSYEARYLYVRLFLRKRKAWFRVDKIGYESDLSDVNRACLDLHCDGFADSESSISGIGELLSLLSLSELKILAKEIAVPLKANTKDKIIDSVLKISASQLGLDFGTEENIHNSQGSLGLQREDSGNFKTKASQLKTKVSMMLGSLVRLSQSTVDLFHRLHIVFYRSSDYNEKSLTTLILARMSKRNFPPYAVDRSLTIFESREKLIEYEKALLLKFEVENIMETARVGTQEGQDRVMEIFEELWEPWQIEVLILQDRMANLQQAPDSPGDGALVIRTKYYTRRFSAGWIWTRIIFKAAMILAKRHEYVREHQLLTSLLSQKIFRIGRRGEWYDRKALLEQHYLSASFTLLHGAESDRERRQAKRKALETCIMALQDPDTHVIYQNALQRRIMRLEKDLRMTKREQHDFSHIIIRKPNTRTITGVRLDNRETGRHSVWQSTRSKRTIVHGEMIEGCGEVGVEELCLEKYEDEGWKGFHSENSIVTTIFAYLFFDILFMPVPGAGVFQTEFQSAPLDLATDAFYPARASEINHRLALIENGGYVDLIKQVNAEHRERETWCVGLKWIYDVNDVLEIATCIGGTALSRICKLFAEEYGHRVGGIGDLCLWDYEKRDCMFVEVKGPGDRLSETQIAWLDEMAAGGIRVELCHVEEVGTEPKREYSRSNSSRSVSPVKVQVKAEKGLIQDKKVPGSEYVKSRDISSVNYKVKVEDIDR